MVTHYKILYGSWVAILRIDEPLAIGVIKRSVAEWAGWRSRLEKFDGDYIRLFLDYLSVELLEASVSSTLDEMRQLTLADAGDYRLDGSHGITLVYCDLWMFDRSKVSIIEACQ